MLPSICEQSAEHEKAASSSLLEKKSQCNINQDLSASKWVRETAQWVDELHLCVIFCKDRSNQCQLSSNPAPALLTSHAPVQKSHRVSSLVLRFPLLCLDLLHILYFDCDIVGKLIVDRGRRYTMHTSLEENPHRAAVTNTPLIDSLFTL